MARSPFRYFKTLPEIIQPAVMLYVKFLLSLRNVEDLLHERGIYVCHESVRLRVDQFRTQIVSTVRKRIERPMRQFGQRNELRAT